MTKPYYERDGITIFHADWRTMLPRVAAVALTDPPYGIEYSSGQQGTSHWHGKVIPGDADAAERDAFVGAWDGPALIFGSWKTPPPERTRMTLVWDKGPALGMGDLSLPWKPSFDLIYVLGEGFAGRRDGAVLYCPPVQSMAKNGRVHPHQKPVALLQTLLGKCPPGIVLDPFMGSGSTLVAAKAMGRRAIGCDLQEWCCEVAARRLEQSVLPLKVTA